jgi:hypothetical protein
MAEVIAEIEGAMLPFLGSNPAYISIDEVDEEHEDEDIPEDDEDATVLGEGARDALAKSLRRMETSLHSMYQMRRLPLRILRLNGRVFWCLFSVALSASIGAFLGYAIVPMPYWLGITSAVIPLSCAGLAVAYAVIRHLKVQSAEENIIDANPSA